MADGFGLMGVEALDPAGFQRGLDPRLDLDNIQCTPSVNDVNDSTFCAPENINVDYPPYGQWFRIGAYYYLNWGNADPVVHPTVKIYCNGHLAGDFGAGASNAPHPAA